MKRKLLIGLGSVIGVFLLIGCAQPSTPALDEETYRLYVEDIMARQLQVLEDLDIEGVMENPEYPPEIEQLFDLSIGVDNLNPPANLSDFHASYLKACSPVRGGALDLSMAWLKWKREDYVEASQYLQTATIELAAGHELILCRQQFLRYLFL